MTIEMRFGGWWRSDVDLYLAAIKVGYTKFLPTHPTVASLGNFGAYSLGEYRTVDIAPGEVLVGRPHETSSGGKVWLGIAGVLEPDKRVGAGLAVTLQGLWSLRFVTPRRLVEIAMPSTREASLLGEHLVEQNLDIASFGTVVLSVPEGAPT